MAKGRTAVTCKGCLSTFTLPPSLAGRVAFCTMACKRVTRARRDRASVVAALIERNRTREARERSRRDVGVAVTTSGKASWQAVVNDASEWIRRVALVVE